MDNIRVSVIIPVYNVERYLDRCLSSLVFQTLKDIELVIINDGSTDGSQKILDDYAARYPDMIRCVQRENGGQATARNLGISMAKGDYLAFVDSDDYVETDMLEKLYGAATLDDADIACCGFRYVYEDGSFKERTISSRIEPGDNIYESRTMLAHASAFVWNKLFRRTLFTETGIVFPDQKMEDVAIAYSLLALARKVSFVEEPLYNYRSTRKGSTSNTLNESTYDIFTACDAILKYYKEHELLEEFRTELEYRVITHITLRFNMLLGVTDGRARDRYVDAAFDYLDGNFPDWRENPYYKEDRQSRVDSDTDTEYFYAKIDRNKLKKFYRKRQLKRKLRKLKLRIMR